METRGLVNCPANLLRTEILAQKLKDMADGLPIEAELYDRQALERLGLRGLLTVGDSSAYAPAMVVLRYTGAPDCGRRLGLVGKGVTVDTGGYCLKPASSMAGIKGDMAGGAAAAAALRALAAMTVRRNQGWFSISVMKRWPTMPVPPMIPTLYCFIVCASCSHVAAEKRDAFRRFWLNMAPECTIMIHIDVESLYFQHGHLYIY